MIGICYVLETEAEIVRERSGRTGKGFPIRRSVLGGNLIPERQNGVTARVVHHADAVENQYL